MKEKIKILFLDDSVGDVELIQRELRINGIEFVGEFVDNSRDYKNALTEFCPDLVLSDYNLPSFTGADAFEVQVDILPEIPFIIVSGAVGEENAVALIKKGVTDYVLKDKLFQLPVKIERALKEKRNKAEKRTSELALVESELRLNKAQIIAHLGSWELHFELGFAVFSKEACKIFGIKEHSDNFSYRKWLSFVHKEDYRYTLEKVKEIVIQKRETKFHHRILRKDGKVRHVNNEVQFVKDNTGKPIGLFGVVHDVTEMKVTESKLLKSKAKYKHLLDNMNDGFIADDVKGKVTFANKRFCEIFGIEEKDTETLVLEDYIAPECRQLLKERRELRTAGKSVKDKFEYQGLRKDGHRIWLEVHVSSIFENRNIVGTQSVIRDITEKKLKELELQKTVNELNERNNELMQFNYIVSHNLRAPIANIIGLSGLISALGVSKEEAQEYNSLIKSSVLKVDDILRDLNVILATRSNINVSKENVSVSDLVKIIIETLRTQIRDADAVIRLDIPTDADELYTVKSYLQSILYNLISNSVKYRSSNRASEIHVSSKKERKLVLIEVSDNGRGIDLSKNGEKVFGIYNRFHMDTEGKGLGLHMTKTQVEALGGKITIDSYPDKGTSFTISMPI